MLTIKRNLAALAAAVASTLALTGCGGAGGGSSTSDTASSTFSITAMDGYLTNADVWVDTNGDNNCETKLDIMTGEGGVVEIPVEYENNIICIKAIAGQTIDETRGVVERTLELKAPAGETTVSPLTNLVVEQLEDDNSLTVAEAKAAVMTELGLNSVTANDVFGDYVAAAASGNDTAKAINIIGEILFDEDGSDAGLTLTEKLAIVNEVSKDAQDAIDSSDIDDFSPDITVADNGTVTVTPNRRPTVTGSAVSETQEINLGELFTSSLVASWFEDDDNDALTYEWKVLPDSGSNLEISGGALTGTPSAAGTYTIYAYARDTNDVRSYPAVFDLNVISPNTPPVVNDDVKNTIQSDITALGLQQNIPVNETVSIAGLFTDADGDALTITVSEGIAGLEITYANDQLTFSGSPSVNTTDSPLSFLVNAYDDVQLDTTNARFDLTIVEGIGSHPLEGTVWYQLERGSDDGDGSNANDYTRVWCDTLQFAGGLVYLNTRTAANRTTCTETPTAAGNYTVESGRIKVTWNDQSTAELALLSDSFASGGHGTLVLYVESGTEALTWFDNKADAETRIQLTRTMPEENGDVQYYRKNGGSYESGQVSVSLGLPEGDEQNGDLDIDLYFDGLPSGVNCETRVKNLFGNFAIARSDFDDSLTVTTEYWDGEDASSCVVDFDITGTTREDQILGVIAYANDALEAEMSSLYFNIQQDYLAEVTANDLNNFLAGASATDYLYQASLNEGEFGTEGIADVSFFDNQACTAGDGCVSYTIADDMLTTNDSETDQFLYVSAENAFAVPLDSGDLIAWSKAAFTNAGWSENQLTGKTWYYVDDDSENSTPAPMIVEFAFGDGTVVMDGDTDNAAGWSITGGELTINLSELPDESSNLTLNRLAPTGNVVIATNTAANNKPLIMTEDKNLASGIYLQWKERIRLLP